MASTLRIFCRHFCCRSAIRQPLSPHHPTATATAATWRTKLPNHTVPPAAIQLTRQQLRLYHLLLQSRAMSQTALYPAAFTRKAAECSAASSEISISNFACKEASRSLPLAKTHNHIPRMRSLHSLGDNSVCQVPLLRADGQHERRPYSEGDAPCSLRRSVVVAAVCCIIIIGCYCLLYYYYWLLLFAAPQCIGC
jgi:hypothetical protein